MNEGTTDNKKEQHPVVAGSTTAGNSLVLYTPTSLEVARTIVQLKKPIRMLRPEHRILFDGGMYAGGLHTLQFDDCGVQGTAYVKYFGIVNKKKEEPCAPSILERLVTSLFGEEEARRVDDSLVVTHNEQKYATQWIVCTDDNDRLIWAQNGKRHPQAEHFKMNLKTRIANERSILVSNEFIDELFEPLCDALYQIYTQTTNF